MAKKLSTSTGGIDATVQAADDRKGTKLDIVSGLLKAAQVVVTCVPVIMVVLWTSVLFVPMSIIEVGALTGIASDETNLVTIIILLVMPAMFMVLTYAFLMAKLAGWWMRKVRSWVNKIQARRSNGASTK